jgi:tetratricopeptide (TPR) repeat protein
MNQELITRLRRLCDDDRYEEAVATIEREQPAHGCCADLLVWKARCLQLGELAGPEQIELTLQAAIACDEDNASAWTELGWFLLNVQDQAEQAQHAFGRALAIQAKENTEVLVGLVKCAKEIRPKTNRDQLKHLLLTSLVNGKELEEALSDGMDSQG